MSADLSQRRSSLKRVSLLFAGLALLCYFPALNGEFVFDDVWLVETAFPNQSLPSLAEVWHQWKRPPTLEEFQRRGFDWGYRPVRNLSFLWDYFFSQLLWGRVHPLPFHLTNLLLHIYSALLLWRLLTLLGVSERVCLLAALLFLLHPVQTESVSYISGRRDVLVGFFSFLSLYLFTKGLESAKRGWYYLGSVFAFLAALGAKEVAVVLPCVLAALVWWRHRKQEQPLRRCWGVVALFFCLAFLYTGWKLFGHNPLRLGFSQTEYWGGSFQNTLLTLPRAYGKYLGLVFFPYTLTVDYSEKAFLPSTDWWQPWTTMPALFAFALGALLIWRFRHSPLLWSVGWFFLFLLPVSQIVPHPERFAEHYLYLPLVGMCVLVAALLEEKLPHFWPCAVLLLLLLGARTFWRNLDWRSSYTLWKSAVEAYPECGRAQLALGKVYFQQGEEAQRQNERKELWRKGLEHIERSLAILEDVPTNRSRALRLHGLFFAGLVSIRLQRWEKAIDYLEKLLQERDPRGGKFWDSPDHIHVHLNLAAAYQGQKSWQKAEKIYRKILHLRPDEAIAMWELAKLLYQQGKWKEAEELLRRAWKKAVRKDVREEIALTLGVLLWNRGKSEESWTFLKKLPPERHPLLQFLWLQRKPKEEREDLIAELLDREDLSPLLTLEVAEVALSTSLRQKALEKVFRLFTRPLSAPLLEKIFLFLWKQGRLELIESHLGRLPGEGQVYWKALVAQRKGRTRKALELFQRAYEKYRSLRGAKSYFLLYAKVFPENLVTEAKKWLREYPREEVSRIVVGALLLQKYFPQALAILREGAKKYGSSFQEWYKTVKALQKKYAGDLRRAILVKRRKRDWPSVEKLVRKALRVSPRGEFYQWLGEALMGQSRWREAELAFRRALAAYNVRDSFSADLWSRVSECAYRASRYGEALRAARRALEIFPNYPLALKYLGLSLFRLKRQEEAKKVLEKYLREPVGQRDREVKELLENWR